MESDGRGHAAAGARGWDKEKYPNEWGRN